MSIFEITLDKLKKEILQTETTNSKNTGRILPTIIGNLEESTEDGLCVCVPTVGENIATNNMSPGMLPCVIKQHEFFIKFAYIQNGEPFLLFYDRDSNKFIGFKINAFLLKIPKYLNDLIIIKLEEFCKTLDTSVRNL